MCMRVFACMFVFVSHLYTCTATKKPATNKCTRSAETEKRNWCEQIECDKLEICGLCVDRVKTPLYVLRLNKHTTGSSTQLASSKKKYAKLREPSWWFLLYLPSLSRIRSIIYSIPRITIKLRSVISTLATSRSVISVLEGIRTLKIVKIQISPANFVDQNLHGLSQKIRWPSWLSMFSVACLSISGP